MSIPKAAPRPSSSSRSPWLLCTAYTALSAVGLYYMRLGPASKYTVAQLEPLTSGSAPGFTYPGREAFIRQHYTGVSGVDGLLSTLVTAFLAGTARWDTRIVVQQGNFLFAWTSVLVVWSVESVRERNGWNLTVFTSFWALLYQTVGGAVIIPIWLLVFAYMTSRPSYYALSPTVPLAKARTLVPAVILGFILPTAAMYYPFRDIDKTRIATAIWQPCPIFVNIVWAVLLRFPGGTASTSRKAHADFPYLKAAYAASGGVAAIAHVVTLYLCASSQYPDVSLRSIFLPVESGITAFPDAVHFIFQVDYLVIFLATTVWCLQTVAQVRGRATPGAGILGPALLLFAMTAAIGPAATLSAVWYWREGRLLSTGRS